MLMVVVIGPAPARRRSPKKICSALNHRNTLLGLLRPGQVRCLTGERLVQTMGSQTEKLS